MDKLVIWKILLMSAMLVSTTLVQSETRRDGGEQSSKKTQYMIRQLHQEKNELKSRLSELQGKYDQLNKEHDDAKAQLEQSSENNEKLVARVKQDIAKYKELAQKYRESVSILRKANMDNQYMVRAVQEREAWISECGTRNQGLFQANSDLLMKYGEAAGESMDIFTGMRKVEVENEVQDYRFKLEDLQVTKFKPAVNTSLHIRRPGEGESAHETDKALADNSDKTANVN